MCRMYIYFSSTISLVSLFYFSIFCLVCFLCYFPLNCCRYGNQQHPTGKKCSLLPKKPKISQISWESESSKCFNYTSTTILNSIIVANPNARAFTPEQYDVAEGILGIVSKNTLCNNVFCNTVFSMMTTRWTLYNYEKSHLSFPKLWLNKFVKLVKLAKTFNHWPKLWWELNPEAIISLMLSQIGHWAFCTTYASNNQPVPCTTMHVWFCRIELIESIWQKKAEF